MSASGTNSGGKIARIGAQAHAEAVPVGDVHFPALAIHRHFGHAPIPGTCTVEILANPWCRLDTVSGILHQVGILQAYGIPIDANWATVWMGLVGFLANILLMCIVRLTGKRNIFLVALALTFSCCFVLGKFLFDEWIGFAKDNWPCYSLSTAAYGFIHLPAGWSSFDKHPAMTEIGTKNYIPLITFILLNFFTNIGVLSLPWMLLSEVFPFK